MNLTGGLSLIHVNAAAPQGHSGIDVPLDVISPSDLRHGQPGVFSATKHSLKGLSEALSVELSPDGGCVADLPRIVDTGILAAEQWLCPRRKASCRALSAEQVADVVWATCHDRDRLHWSVPAELAAYGAEETSALEITSDRWLQAMRSINLSTGRHLSGGHVPQFRWEMGLTTHSNSQLLGAPKEAVHPKSSLRGLPTDSPGMKLVTSQEDFWKFCPAAGRIARYVSELPDLGNSATDFVKAMIRPEHTTALFTCTDPQGGPLELWVSAASDGLGGWTVQHMPLPGSGSD